MVLVDKFNGNKMLPGTIVVNVVLERLKNAASAGLLPKLQKEDIGANPRHRVPVIIGQNGVTVNITNAVSRYTELQKFTAYNFEVVYIRRIREIPNDQFETLYHQANEIPDFHEIISSLIPSWKTLQLTRSYLERNHQRFKEVGIYHHMLSQLNPIPLYGSYFGGKEIPPSNKVAGFKTITTFRSPEFYELLNPQLCTNA